jgi:hypothetical protein
MGRLRLPAGLPWRVRPTVEPMGAHDAGDRNGETVGRP